MRLFAARNLSSGAKQIVDLAHEAFGAFILTDDFIGTFGLQIDVITDHECYVESGIVLLDLFAKVERGVVRFIGFDDDEIAD